MTVQPETTVWTAVPAAPKVPNFWQALGYTLHYASPGWDVHEGTHDSKGTLGDVLFHARKAAEAKSWVEQQPVAAPEPDPQPRKPRARKPKAKKSFDQEVADTIGEPYGDAVPEPGGETTDYDYDALLSGEQS